MSVRGQWGAGVLEWEPEGPSVRAAQNFPQEVAARVLTCLTPF